MLEPSGFREIAKSATVNYPIPFVFALCLVFALLALGGAASIDGPVQWVLVGFAAVVVLYGLGLMTFAALKARELLRSEQHHVVDRMLDMIDGDNLSPQTIDELGRVLSQEPRSKKSGDARRQRT